MRCLRNKSLQLDDVVICIKSIEPSNSKARHVVDRVKSIERNLSCNIAKLKDCDKERLPSAFALL